MKEKWKKIPICKNYTTSGHPNFEPRCLKRKKASLKCHHHRKDCKYYEPSYTADRRVV